MASVPVLWDIDHTLAETRLAGSGRDLRRGGSMIRSRSGRGFPGETLDAARALQTAGFNGRALP